MYKPQNTGQLTTQIDELKKEISALKREKGAIFYRPVRRFLCGAPICPSCRYCFVCRFFFTLLSLITGGLPSINSFR